MVDVIDLEHIRRARRVFLSFVARLGIDHYVVDGDSGIPRLHPARLLDTEQMAIEWLHRRTARRPQGRTLVIMRRDLKRLLVRRLAERFIAAGL